MKILQVVTSLQTGGAEKIVTDLTLALHSRGHKVDVVSFAGGDTIFKQKLKSHNCRVREFSEMWDVYNWKFIFKLRRLMRAYDIVHTHNTSAQLFAALANIHRKTKLVTTEHSTNNRRRNWVGYRPIDRWMYGQYDKTVCISDIAKEKLQEYLGSSAHHKIITINNGVDVSRFYNEQPLTELSHPNQFIAVMVAGFREAKDQDTLIKAISLLPEEYRLWLVGDGVRRSELENLISSLQLQQRVTLLGVRSDVPNILKSADVVVMSSHWEGLSLSNIEGMASGKPFVASDVNGLHEVTEGYGILFPHEDAKALSVILQRLHDDETYYQQVAEACYRRAQMFDINKMVDEYVGVYKSLLERK